MLFPCLGEVGVVSGLGEVVSGLRGAVSGLGVLSPSPRPGRLSQDSGRLTKCSGEVGSGLGGIVSGPIWAGGGGATLPLGVGERPPDGVGPHDLAKNSVSFTWVRLRRACS